MVDYVEEGPGIVWLRWLVVVLAFGLTVFLPLASADRGSSALGLPVDLALTTVAVPVALIVLAFWYAGRADKSARRRSGA